MEKIVLSGALIPGTDRLDCWLAGATLSGPSSPLPPEKDQDALLETAERHGLTPRETLTLLSAYRVADEPDRRRLLKEPLGEVTKGSN